MSPADPLAAVHRYIEAINVGDAAVMTSMFDTGGVILDGMAPHVWLGPSAAENWPEMSSSNPSATARRAMRSPWARHGTTTSPATALTSSYPRP